MGAGFETSGVHLDYWGIVIHLGGVLYSSLWLRMMTVQTV